MDKEVDFKGKVGSAMASLIPDWAVSVKGGCSCKDWEKKMNNWGVESCDTDNRVAIVQHLMSQEEHLIPVLKALPAFAKRIAANKLLDKAIKLSS